MATGLEIGGWFASAFLCKLADQIRSYIGHQYAYQTAIIKDKLRSLEGNLMEIQAAMYAAEQRQIENPALQALLRDLKDASYDAEDVLDKFEYRLLEDKVQEKGEVRCDFTFTRTNLSKHASSIVKRLCFRDADLNDLLEIVDRFDKISAKMVPLLRLVGLERVVPPSECAMMESRVTTSTLVEPKMFGRDGEKTRLTSALVGSQSSEGGSSRRNAYVLPIVGIGGVGKTAIAQSVYNDDRIKDHFDLRAWVCVSDKFELKRLMKEIVESASIQRPPDFHSLQNLDRIQEILKRGLDEKRFLIVLDDVWEVVTSKWEILLSTFDSGKEGSRVIVTTRVLRIAGFVGTMEGLTLKGLDDDNYWKLFAQCAFGDRNRKDHGKMESIARTIAKRLGGLPLAAKTVGGMLKSDFREEHWKKILESKLWDMKQHGGNVMPVLRLSYQHLPAHLRQCFVYCSMFPKDYEFSEDKLIRMWMAQGFVQSSQGKTLEDIGRTYLGELLSRSFFETIIGGCYYVVHDLLHDLAQLLSDGENLIVEDTESSNRMVEIPKRVRHLYINASSLDMVCNIDYAKKNLRSLVVAGSISAISLDILKEFRGLRTLQLADFDVRCLPESIGQLLHLRYLELEDASGFKKLPKSICKLYHLQVLVSFYYDGIFPKKIYNLINLRYLHPSREKIARIGKLTYLQGLHFTTNVQERGFEMRQLRNMRELRYLSIYGLGNVRSKEEALEAKLDNKAHLRNLELWWAVPGHQNNAGDQVLEGLRPHQCLESLEIYGYMGIKSPNWLEGKWLSNVSHITLISCHGWKVLPPLGQLPFLEVLHLQDMRAVEKIGHEFYGSNDASSVTFPSLKRLSFHGLSQWKEWLFEVGQEESSHRLFPRLSYLVICNCPNLMGPVFLPSPLKKLTVDERFEAAVFHPQSAGFYGQDISILTEWLQTQSWSLPSLEDVTIRNSTVTSFNVELEEWFQHLANSLQKLSIIECKTLQSLPSSLKTLTSLNELFIKRCDQINSLPEEGLPSSTRKLEIMGCNPMLEERCRKDGFDWHKISHIPMIEINGKVVQ